MKRKLAYSFTVLFLLLTARPAPAGIVDVEVDGNVVSAGVELTGGIEADLTITFEEVESLTEESIGLSASLVNPLDPGFLSRLPGLLASIPSAFPVLIQVDPPAAGELEFHGPVRVEIVTPELSYGVGTKLRLFSAPLGGDFEDVTAETGSGSYRVDGDTPELATDYMILLDLRNVHWMIESKLTALENALDEHSGSIDSGVLAELESLIEDARDAYEGDDYETAIDEVEAFAAEVEQESGGNIPDRWKAAEDLDNVGGLLRARASTLRFSLLEMAADP